MSRSSIYRPQRYDLLTAELLRRNFKLYHIGSFLDFCKYIPQEFFGNFTPVDRDFLIIRNRIDEKLMMRPNWYRYYGVKI